MTATKHATIAAEVQRWRRSVVRGWVVTMFAALAAWAAAAVWPLTPAVEAAAGLTLVSLGACAYWNMRRGRCPRCRAKIRFEPRIELPKRCAGCGMPFSSGSDGTEE